MPRRNLDWNTGSCLAVNDPSREYSYDIITKDGVKVRLILVERKKHNLLWALNWRNHKDGLLTAGVLMAGFIFRLRDAVLCPATDRDALNILEHCKLL